MDKRGEVSSFSVGTLLSHSAEKFHRGILLCFRKYLVSKKFKEERGREYQDFPSKIFCLAVPKKFVGESFSTSLFSVIEKFYASERGGGEFQYFLSKMFCLTVPKFSVEGGSFTVAISSGNEKVSIRGGAGSIKIFRRKTFVSQCRNFS